MPTLTIKNLYVSVGAKKVLRGVNLNIRPGTTHALMGPNGCGKSTLVYAIMRHPRFKTTGGMIKFGKHDLRKLTTEKIAQLGILAGFQQSPELEGISAVNLLRMVLGRRSSLADFSKSLNTAAAGLRLPKEFLTRSLNSGFSGGEKKKTELLQLALLKPKFVIFDEIDAGLDVDALKLVARQILKMKKQGIGILIITHYNRVLKYLKPDYVHIMREGKIVRSGKLELAKQVEKSGYELLNKKL